MAETQLLVLRVAWFQEKPLQATYLSQFEGPLPIGSRICLVGWDLELQNEEFMLLELPVCTTSTSRSVTTKLFFRDRDYRVRADYVGPTLWIVEVIDDSP